MLIFFKVGRYVHVVIRLISNKSTYLFLISIPLCNILILSRYFISEKHLTLNQFSGLSNHSNQTQKIENNNEMKKGGMLLKDIDLIYPYSIFFTSILWYMKVHK